MPSIPQSVLWISLVVLWLFVLVPMLISKRDAVRRTSDVALATRVLNGAGGMRRLRRGGPAAGHRSDPDWQPADGDFGDFEDFEGSREVVVSARRVDIDSDVGDGEQDYLDVEVVVENSGALTAAAADVWDADTADVALDAEADEADEAVEDAEDGTADEYEYVEDTSGLESSDDPPTAISRRTSSSAARRRERDSRTAAAVSARKYRFRKRVLSVMVLAVVVSGVATLAVWPEGRWLCTGAGAFTVLYLAYLRRQTRIEDRLRHHRMQRMVRSRLGVDNTEDDAFDLVPSRLRRPGAAVLEIDDEDPIFEHLDYASAPDEYHLPRAAGQ